MRFFLRKIFKNFIYKQSYAAVFGIVLAIVKQAFAVVEKAVIDCVINFLNTVS